MPGQDSLIRGLGGRGANSAHALAEALGERPHRRPRGVEGGLGKKTRELDLRREAHQRCQRQRMGVEQPVEFFASLAELVLHVGDDRRRPRQDPRQEHAELATERRRGHPQRLEQRDGPDGALTDESSGDAGRQVRDDLVAEVDRIDRIDRRHEHPYAVDGLLLHRLPPTVAMHFGRRNFHSLPTISLPRLMGVFFWILVSAASTTVSPARSFIRNAPLSFASTASLSLRFAELDCASVTVAIALRFGFSTNVVSPCVPTWSMTESSWNSTLTNSPSITPSSRMPAQVRVTRFGS